MSICHIKLQCLKPFKTFHKTALLSMLQGPDISNHAEASQGVHRKVLPPIDQPGRHDMFGHFHFTTLLTLVLFLCLCTVCTLAPSSPV